MPCTAPVRGKTDTEFPWVDAVNDDPCGKAAVIEIDGEDVSAESLCLGHWAAVHGLSDVKGQVVFE